MKYRLLGKSGIQVSTIAMGCWGLAGGEMWGRQDEDQSIATVAAALDAGVNFFDNAEAYGNGLSEEVLGKALKGRRHQAIIATKIRSHDLSAQAVTTACERSLKRLQTDYIDLYQTHWPDRSTPIAETLDALHKLQNAGKVREIGVSNFGERDLSELLEQGSVVTNQLPYSLLWRAIEYEIQSVCVNNHIGILCYSALLHGLLTGKYSRVAEFPPSRARTRHFSKLRPLVRHDEDGCEQETFAAIRRIRLIAEREEIPMAILSTSWVLHRQGVCSVIVGARRPEQVSQIAQAADLTLSKTVLDELTGATETLKQTLGPNADMWQSTSRFR